MIFQVALVSLDALAYIETKWRSQGLGLNRGLDVVYFSKASIVLLYESYPNPNPYDFSSGYGETLCIRLNWDTIKITRVRVKHRVGCGTFQ